MGMIKTQVYLPQTMCTQLSLIARQQAVSAAQVIADPSVLFALSGLNNASCC
jgi:hypothetical protein